MPETPELQQGGESPPLRGQPPTVRIQINRIPESTPERPRFTLNCFVNDMAVDPPTCVQDILEFFNPAQKRQLRPRSYDSILNAINRATIAPRVWADVLGQWFLAREARKDGAAYESRAIDEGAYLTFGDTLYRLSPVAAVRTNKALATAKRKALESCQNSRDQILAEARVNADALLAEARAKLAEAEEAQRLARTRTPPPILAYSGVPITWDRVRSTWMAQMDLELQIEGFDLTFPLGQAPNVRRIPWSFNAPAPAGAEDREPVKTSLLIPIGSKGEYNVTSIKVAPNAQVLPHIGRTGACLSVGDAPATLQTALDWARLRISLKRAMSRVQLDSLLCGVGEWREALRPFTPPALYKCFEEGLWGLDLASREWAAANPGEGANTEITLEGDDEWTVETTEAR